MVSLFPFVMHFGFTIRYLTYQAKANLRIARDRWLHVVPHIASRYVLLIGIVDAQA